MSIYQKIATLPDDVAGILVKKALIIYRDDKFDQEHPMNLKGLADCCNDIYAVPGDLNEEPIPQESFQPILWTIEDVKRGLKYLKRTEAREIATLLKGIERRFPDELQF
jgi:hypothetical protein